MTIINNSFRAIHARDAHRSGPRTANLIGKNAFNRAYFNGNKNVLTGVV